MKGQALEKRTVFFYSIEQPPLKRDCCHDSVRKENLMVVLFVTSFERSTGKDLVTMGLMDRLGRDGFKVGYFKPFGHIPVEQDGTVADKGALFIHRLFGLDDPIESVCPVVVTEAFIRKNYEQDVPGLEEKVKKAFEGVSEQKDVVVVNCDYNVTEGSSFGLSGARLIKVLGAHALFVERYTRDFCVDCLLGWKHIVGRPMIGVVFNRVEAHDLDEIRNPVSLFLDRNGLDVYGALPRDRVLASIGIRDLVGYLKGDVVCGKDGLDALVEGFLVGGMQVDKFITYMLKSPCSAVIVGGDRTDIQLVAIENGAKCLILSGNLYPNRTITARAEARGVPVVVVGKDTFTVAKEVESIPGKLSLQDRKKIDHGINLVSQCFDFEKLYKTIGLREAL
jgi:BioD-like phosphotransacetylase family protein